MQSVLTLLIMGVIVMEKAPIKILCVILSFLIIIVFNNIYMTYRLEKMGANLVFSTSVNDLILDCDCVQNCYKAKNVEEEPVMNETLIEEELVITPQIIVPNCEDNPYIASIEVKNLIAKFKTTSCYKQNITILQGASLIKGIEVKSICDDGTGSGRYLITQKRFVNTLKVER